MNTMIKVRKSSSNDFYIFSLINRNFNRYKAKNFYISTEDVQRAVSLAGMKCVISKDVYSFCEMRYCSESDRLEMEFYILDNAGEYLKGQRIRVKVNYPPMVAWCNLQPDEEYKELCKEEKETGKLKICDDKSLKRAIANPVVRKKLGKALIELAGNNKEITTNLYSDGAEYSFYFVKMRGEKRDYNGGLIFHKDYKNPADLSKGKYSVHT
jgi:hypothetical protein